MNIEESVKEFAALASKHTLSKADHKEARTLMCKLKQAGMTNKEISELSKGKWTPSTVKFYTPGVKPGHHGPWQTAVALLDNLVSTNMTLNDIETALTIFKDLNSQDINLDQVIDLLVAANSAPIDLATLVQQSKELAESGLSPASVAEAIGLRKQLEGNGLSLDYLPMLVELAQNYGNPQEVLKALSSYGSLGEVEHEIGTAKQELEDLSAQNDSADQKLQETQTKLSEMAKPLDAYDKALTLGFGEEELGSLSVLANKFGGPKAVFQALKAYTNYTEINKKVSKAKSEFGNLESDIGRLSAKHSHLTTAIDMCQTLMSEYKFGLDVIVTILSVAKDYGDPVTVLKAVETYGNLEALQHETVKLEGVASELKLEIARLEGGHGQALNKLESLNALALEVGNEVGKVQGELAASDQVKRLLALVNNPFAAEYAEHISVALLLTVSMRQWVSKNESKFKYANNIRSGLENLIKELGGLL